MQKLLISLVLFGSSLAVSAPIYCGGKNSPWSLSVSSNWQSATLQYKKKVPQFGQLVCRSTRTGRSQVFMRCQSPHVADAGYSASLYRSDTSSDLFVKIEEAWFGGSHHRATLRCVAAVHERR